MSENDRHLDDLNPYRPPSSVSPEEKPPALPVFAKVEKTEPTPTKIRLRAIIDEWFAIFQNRFGTFFRLGVLFPVMFLFLTILPIASFSFIIPFLEVVFDEQLVFVMGSIFFFAVILISMVTFIWLYLGCISHFLKMARGHESAGNTLFSSRKYLLRGCLIFLFMYIANFLVVTPPSAPLIFAINSSLTLGEFDYVLPALLMTVQSFLLLIVGFFFILNSVVFCFLIDDDCGAMRAVRLAWEFSKNNRWTLGLLGGLAFLSCSCAFIAFVSPPLVGSVCVVTYLRMTGQPSCIRHSLNEEDEW